MTSLDLLGITLGFQTWAEPRGYDMATDAEGTFLNLETRSAWLGYLAAHGEDGCKPVGQQLYARMRPGGRYAHQTDKLFPVRVGKAPYDDYVVHGGPGGVYALRDVHFFVLVDGKPMRLDGKPINAR
ncbi:MULTISPECIES: hypothetical protein [unclassified Pseudomonas]|uniref:hypothetical protein n=1 Tax=unclassified Pseudomonas TaxID=196821 RepID=UPI00244A7753|nr:MULTISPECIES: hypothetical protein [unclassified Pseudomonas]MDH0894662.1 hypothetical protein [Pseudomonas sp. GD03875]MDH1067288.1 hypothetical protein [Pseudomonas sp. GD03985]